MKTKYLGSCALVLTMVAASASARDAATAAASVQGAISPTTGSTTAQPTGTPNAAPASASEQSGIQDIIVTAQRRTESLQKAALSIAVIQPRALANAGITSPLQLTSLLPSVQVGNSGPATAVYIRGVGAFASTAAISPAIPYYIDGVYVSRNQSVPSELYDVDRVEVLKGPQGTLYGRNASGGALNFLTRRPVLGKFGVMGAVEIGNYRNRNGELAVNIPIGETFALRASGIIVDKGGYTSTRLSDDVHEGVRLKALWQPDSTLSVLLNGSYGHIGGKGPGAVVLNKDIQCSNATPPSTGCSNVKWYPWLDATSAAAKKYTEDNGVVPFPPFVQGNTPDQAHQNLRFYNISAELNYQMGPITLTLLPSYRYAKMQYATTFSFLYENGYGLGAEPPRPETSKQSSLEVRLTGNGNRFKWTAGLYYYNEDQFQQYTISNGILLSPGVDTRFGTRSYAAFGQGTYQIASKVRLIGGLRYTSDRRSIKDGQSFLIAPTAFNPAQVPFLPPYFLPCAFPAPTADRCLIDQYKNSITYKNVSWKAGIEADVLGDSLAYATVSRGFKAGGFNTQSIPSDPGSPTHVGTALEVKPELLTSFEAGLKNRFLNNKLQVNLEAFYWDYKGHQEPKLGLTPNGSLNLIFFNAGSTRLYGGDLDIIATPWRGGTFNFSAEYVHSKYQDFRLAIPYLGSAPVTGCPYTVAGPIATIDCSGFTVARTPKWTGSVGFTQVVEVGSGRVIGNANMTFASSRYTNIEFIPIEKAKSYAKLDAALTYETAGGRLSLTGFVRNITDASIYSSSNINVVSKIVTATIDAPRTYGARLGFKF